MTKYCLWILSTILVLSGCVRDRSIEEIKLIESLGYDVEGNQISGSAAFHLYQDVPPEAPVSLFTATSDTPHGIFLEFTSQSTIPVEIGQTRSLVVSEDMAKQGISELIGTLIRDPVISNNARIVISRQNAQNVLSLIMKYPPYYFSNLVENNMETGNFPISNVHYVLSQFYGEGQDVYLPIIKIEEPERITMDGLGILKDGKLTLQLTNEETLFFKLLKDQHVTGMYELKNDDQEKIFFRILNGKNEIKFKDNTAEFYIEVNLQVKDFPKSYNLSKKKDVQVMTTVIEKHLTEKLDSLLKKLQENKVDPVGIGEIFRENQRNWTQEQFDKNYPNLPFNISVRVKIVQTGVGN
ncbi:Ger(x)C family spore germination protein [Sutcliffiella halmapala]|uniref:Ger(x)C family spore germination protein n=1 Tax=Sutcliffiella halmapala TaxID=79882 RepID=UPI000994EF5C|nr:Ger(x)C family spore germination protein [Sutcliffiella halmapala]